MDLMVLEPEVRRFIRNTTPIHVHRSHYVAGFTSFGSLPTFPYIGAFDAIFGWNSPACGSCWKLTYQGRTITVLGVDGAYNGIVISEEAMNMLTAGQAVQLGVVQASYVQVASSTCGL